MLRLITALTLLAGVIASSPAQAATELRRVQTTVEVDENSVTLDRLVKYVEYVAGETLAVTLNYSGTCNVVFGSLALRGPNPFTPRVVTGTVENVVGDASGVTFDLTFDTLKQAGKSKQFGKAHLTLVLGIDEDCDPSTGDADGVDDTLSIPVKISVSTADHP
jgi:hypothetical protein